MATSKVVGLPLVLRNMNLQINRIKGATLAGLYDAGLQIQGAAQKRTPVDTGNLKASAYTRKVNDTAVEVGFTAAYAPFVHENLEARHVVGEAKFLEHAVTENRKDIIEIIRRRSKVTA